MNKTGFKVKIATVIQFILCLIFAFAIWISAKYADMYSNNYVETPEEQTTDASYESNYIEV